MLWNIEILRKVVYKKVNFGLLTFFWILNYFILLPAYEILFSISENTIISLGNTINPLIFDRFTFILFIVCPFNLFKGALICSVTLILYKRLSVVINNLFKDFVK